ncbi:unnamed protein product [Cyprideis torosa]|uniref:Uncharacterized protein n=1 Tax=Cyprideis torosa TaxID=163714 RepID=A0A7R8ZKT1_9CRUS|nr:unnamed protein product [Cyprideis torosa]CAG0891810.1 unnamed protein product [Cyprideis torosa]
MFSPLCWGSGLSVVLLLPFLGRASPAPSVCSVAAPGYAVESIARVVTNRKGQGDVDHCEMTYVPQGQFTPLPDAICWVIHDLTMGHGPRRASFRAISRELREVFPDTVRPRESLIHATLQKLIRERKVFQAQDGYGIVTPSSTFAGSRMTPDEQELFMSEIEALELLHEASHYHSPDRVRRKSTISVREQQVCFADILRGAQPGERVVPPAAYRTLTPEPHRPSAAAVRRRSSVLNRAIRRRLSIARPFCSQRRRKRISHPKRTPNKELPSRRSPLPPPSTSDVTHLKDDIVIGQPKKQSWLSKFFSGPRAAKEKPTIHTFGGQFPPPEWTNGTLDVGHSVSTQTCFTHIKFRPSLREKAATRAVRLQEEAKKRDLARSLPRNAGTPLMTSTEPPLGLPPLSRSFSLPYRPQFAAMKGSSVPNCRPRLPLPHNLPSPEIRRRIHQSTSCGVNKSASGTLLRSSQSFRESNVRPRPQNAVISPLGNPSRLPRCDESHRHAPSPPSTPRLTPLRLISGCTHALTPVNRRPTPTPDVASCAPAPIPDPCPPLAKTEDLEDSSDVSSRDSPNKEAAGEQGPHPRGPHPVAPIVRKPKPPVSAVAPLVNPLLNDENRSPTPPKPQHSSTTASTGYQSGKESDLGSSPSTPMLQHKVDSGNCVVLPTPTKSSRIPRFVQHLRRSSGSDNSLNESGCRKQDSSLSSGGSTKVFRPKTLAVGVPRSRVFHGNPSKYSSYSDTGRTTSSSDDEYIPRKNSYLGRERRSPYIESLWQDELRKLDDQECRKRASSDSETGSSSNKKFEFNIKITGFSKTPTPTPVSEEITRFLAKQQELEQGTASTQDPEEVKGEYKVFDEEACIGERREVDIEIRQGVEKREIGTDPMPECRNYSRFDLTKLSPESEHTYLSLSDLTVNFKSVVGQKLLQGYSANSIDTLMELDLAEKNKVSEVPDNLVQTEVVEVI